MWEKLFISEYLHAVVREVDDDMVQGGSRELEPV